MTKIKNTNNITVYNIYDILEDIQFKVNLILQTLVSKYMYMYIAPQEY